jgi:hypothetical protein
MYGLKPVPFKAKQTSKTKQTCKAKRACKAKQTSEFFAVL